MQDYLQKLKKHPRFKQLTDARNIGLYGFGVIVLLVSWSSVKVIQDNYMLQRDIASMEEQNKVNELENETIRLRNQYLTTDHFLELSARRQFGKAAPGETVYVVPEAVALSYSVPERTQAVASAKAAPTRSNLQAWVDFILHRQED